MPRINFGEYLPDLPPFDHPGVVKALNTDPHAIGYGPRKSLQATGVAALDARARGAVNGKDNTGQSFEIAGTQTKLWYTTTGSPVDVTRSTAAYTTVAAGGWEIVQYGQHIFATNYTDEVQYASLSTLSGVAPFVANEADNSWNIPNARHIGVVRDFVMLGNINDTFHTSDGQVPERVHWGPIGTPNQAWPAAGSSAAKAVQSDFQDIRGGRGGGVQRVVGASEIGILFMEKEVWRADYIGGTEFFSFFPVEEDHGCYAPGSVSSHGRWSFFLSEEGFYKTDGYQSVAIGKERINRTFFDNLNREHLDRIVSAIDPRSTRYIIAYPSTASSGNPDMLLIYDYVLDKWSHGEEDLETLTQVLPSGLNADTQLTAGTAWLAGTESTTSTSNSLTNDLIDGTAGIVTNLDAATFLGSSWELGGFDTNHAQARFDGLPKTVEIDTGDFEINPGWQTHVRGVRPVGVTASMSVAVSAKDLPNDAVAFGTNVAPTTATGLCDFRSEGRYHRARTTVTAPAAGDKFQGLDVDADPVGVR